MSTMKYSVFSSDLISSPLHLSIPQAGCKISVFNREDNSNIGLVLARDNDKILISSLKPMEIGKQYQFSIVDVPPRSDFQRIATVNVTNLWYAKQSACVYYICFKLEEPKDRALSILGDYNLKPDAIEEFAPNS